MTMTTDSQATTYRMTPSSTGEVKEIRAQFHLTPSVNDTLNELADREQTSRNDIIERAILAYAKETTK